MHNIKNIRANFENFKNKLKNRNVNIDLNNIIILDKKNRELIQNKETLEKEKKDISKKKIKVYLRNQKKFLIKLIYYLKNKKILKTI